jgi:hypothetical protein
MSVLNFVTACALSSAALTAQLVSALVSTAQSTDPVIQWNRNLLAIVRTPGAQPATIHPTRSFAILHAAIYDAVNAIDQTHRSYAVRVSGVSRQASQAAAADAAAHDVLVALYPRLTSNLDATFQQSLTLVQDGVGKTEGIRIGQAVARGILALRSNDGADQAPLPYVFGTAPGDYQSTPPQFPEAAAVHALAECDAVRSEAGRSIPPRSSAGVDQRPVWRRSERGPVVGRRRRHDGDA